MVSRTERNRISCMRSLSSYPSMWMILVASELVVADGVSGSLCSSAKGNSAKSSQACQCVRPRRYPKSSLPPREQLCTRYCSNKQQSRKIKGAHRRFQVTETVTNSCVIEAIYRYRPSGNNSRKFYIKLCMKKNQKLCGKKSILGGKACFMNFFISRQ